MNDATRTWGLRLLALGLAIGLWFSVSFEDREALSERLVEASVSYNRPRGFVILDPVPSVNETHYVARLKHYWNPEWCKGDLFLQSTDTQVVFIWLFGWLTRWLSLSATTWVCRAPTSAADLASAAPAL